jgi:neutrophil cytosolic factor 2
MAHNPEVPYLEFMQRVAAKFETTVQSIAFKFRDEDGGKVSLRDESDYELVIETARESAKGRPEGKLELWCEIK